MANIAHMLSTAAGIKNPETNLPYTPSYFAPWLSEKSEEEEKFATKEEIMALFPIRKPH